MEKPNIKLRVYRRYADQIVLIYNCLQLNKDIRFNPEIIIDKKNIVYTLITEKSTNTSEGDIKVIIDHEENGLNEFGKYLIQFKFGNDEYKLLLEPKGVVPNLKDDLKKTTQMTIWDNHKQRWVKVESLIDCMSRNNLLVHDANNNLILNDILKELKEIKKLLKKKRENKVF